MILSNYSIVSTVEILIVLRNVAEYIIGPLNVIQGKNLLTRADEESTRRTSFWRISAQRLRRPGSLLDKAGSRRGSVNSSVIASLLER